MRGCPMLKSCSETPRLSATLDHTGAVSSVMLHPCDAARPPQSCCEHGGEVSFKEEPAGFMLGTRGPHPQFQALIQP